MGKGRTNASSGRSLVFNTAAQASTTQDPTSFTFNNTVIGTIYTIITTNNKDENKPITSVTGCEILAPYMRSYSSWGNVSVGRMIVKATATSITVNAPAAYEYYTYRLM